MWMIRFSLRTAQFFPRSGSLSASLFTQPKNEAKHLSMLSDTRTFDQWKLFAMNQHNAKCHSTSRACQRKFIRHFQSLYPQKINAQVTYNWILTYLGKLKACFILFTMWKLFANIWPLWETYWVELMNYSISWIAILVDYTVILLLPHPSVIFGSIINIKCWGLSSHIK